MSSISNNLQHNLIQKKFIYLAPITFVVGAILASLGGYLAHRFGSLSIRGAVGIGAGGTTGALLLAVAIVSSSQIRSKGSASSSTSQIKEKDGADPSESTSPKIDNPPRGNSTTLNLEQQLETAQGAERIRIRANIAASTVHGIRFDPDKHRIAFICQSGEEASQVAYALFHYAYPKMELLPPHGMHHGFDPSQMFFEPRCTAPNPEFFAQIGVQPVPKFGEKELGPAACTLFETDHGDQIMKNAINQFYSGVKSKTTYFLVFGSEGLRNAVAEKIGRNTNCILSRSFDPTGNYEEMANQIIDAIANGLFLQQQAQQ